MKVKRASFKRKKKKNAKADGPWPCMKFSSTPNTNVHRTGTSIPYLKFNTRFIMFPLFSKEYDQQNGQPT